MAPARYRFEGFTLDTAERRLLRGDAPVELGGRYFDALALLVADAGRLVSKDRFLEEAWNGIPVTEEALTQCIRTLRRELGDSASDPRFIETVPKHGYRFIAQVVADGVADAPAAAPAATLASPAQGWTWQQSLLLAAAGVSAGIAASALLPGPRWRWSIAGGALGGMLVGAVVKLLGLDAFNLLLGRSPGDITGGAEGLLLGASVGFGLWFGARRGREPWTRRSVIAATVAGAVAGIVIPLSGGRLMGGSLDLLASSFEGSRLRLDRIGALFGEPGFGPVSQAVTGAMEGALFGACIVGAMVALAPLVAARASLPAE